jgi:hypothetical protein
MTNSGAQTTGAGLATICANIYAFSPDEQMIACCACPLTTSELARISARDDLVENTLTPARPASIVVKIAASSGTACNAAGVSAATLARGLIPWMTTLHGGPGGPAATEIRFSPAALSPAELARLTSFCAFIQANGSGYGICRPCRPGAAGADKR